MIQQLVVDLGDGTYAVHLEKSILNNNKFYRVDADLPVANDGDTVPQFAGLGAEDSLWVALVEKAYAIDRERLPGTEWRRHMDPLGQTASRTGRHLSVADAFRDFANLGRSASVPRATRPTSTPPWPAIATRSPRHLDGNGDPTTIGCTTRGAWTASVWDASGNFVDFSGSKGRRVTTTGSSR